MKISERAQLCGRLALANEKAAGELSALLDKWVQKHFTKATSAQALAVLRSSGALPALVAWLTSRSSTADVLAIIRKVDQHNKEILSSPPASMIAHVEKLASGLAPVEKPKPAPKAKKGAKAKAA